VDVDASVVFSPESYLPRSAHVALTANVLGRELPLVHVSARAKGLEPLFEAAMRSNHFFKQDPMATFTQLQRSPRLIT
jgi:hypothetical protein